MMLSTMRWTSLSIGLGASLALVVACGSKAPMEAPTGHSGTSSSSSGSASAGSQGAVSGSSSGSSAPPLTGPTSPAPSTGTQVPALATAPATALPTLPSLTNVVATEREDSVGIDFDPVDKAVDYRVYPLPADGDVTANKDGSVTIKNAVYRCAGIRQTDELPNNTTNDVMNAANSYVNGQYSWKANVPATPTLGYVYPVSGTGLVPVYAVGVHPSSYEVGWRESRPKVYTTDTAMRQTLLAAGGRDDGIAFYVPSAPSATTQTLYHSEMKNPVQNWTQYSEYYFLGADMASHMSDTSPPTAAFQVLTAAATGTKPLMAVFYQPAQQHTELAVGQERFNRASNQGPGPLWHLEWSGISQPTTLVVEALASGCPYQGFLAPEHMSAPPHQAFLTLSDLQTASTTGEVFLNGQYDLPGATQTAPAWMKTPNASPVPLARSFVQVSPVPHDPAAWDFYEGFSASSTFGTAMATADPEYCKTGDTTCAHFTSPTFDIGAYSIDNPTNVPLFAYGQFLGQFWDAFDDWKQDVTGSVRFTAEKATSIATDATQFLHVTWSVDTVTTGRRYPQLIVSDQMIPVQDGFKNTDGNFLIIQTIQGPSMRFEVEAFHGLVKGNPWAVNNQAPYHALVDYDNWSGGMNTDQTIPPAEPPFEHAGMDRMTKYDAYISSERLYVFVDGTPAGCTLYPTTGFALSGPVSVTFGDVLYHEGAETEVGSCVAGSPTGMPFLLVHQCTETKRHWDDLGFKSGVNVPEWDSTRFPCVSY